MTDIKKCAEQIDKVLKEFNVTIVAEVLVGNGYSKAVVRLIPAPEQEAEAEVVTEDESK